MFLYFLLPSECCIKHSIEFLLAKYFSKYPGWKLNLIFTSIAWTVEQIEELLFSYIFSIGSKFINHVKKLRIIRKYINLRLLKFFRINKYVNTTAGWI